MINDEINGFINAYRDSLERQRDLGQQGLENARRNQFQNIMGSANRAGMMYSNFPERTKIQYDTATHMPAVIKNQQTYQTGLDKLRSNTVNLYNQLATINQAISDLNNTSTGSTGGTLPNPEDTQNPDNNPDDNQKQPAGTIWTPVRNDDNTMLRYGLYELRRNDGESLDDWRKRSNQWLMGLQLRRY